MPNPSLNDLLAPRDRDTIEAILLSTLQAEGFPVTDWEVGGVARTVMKMIATGLLDRETLIGYIAAGGYLDPASSLVDPNGNPIEDWMELLAQEQYGLTRAPATFTQKRVTLTCSAGPGPYTRDAGQIVLVSQAGNYYRNAASVTIPDGGSVVATFVAEVAGSSIRDATGTIDELSTPLPGVTCLDGQTQFSDPVKSQIGTGTITPSSSHNPPSPSRTLKVQVTTSGRLSDHSAIYSVTKYVGSTVVDLGSHNMTSSTFVDGDVTLTFADGALGETSFMAGDTWYVTAPGESTIVNGVDQEALQSLAQRCRDRWPSLSAIPTEGKYAGWVRQCSIENALGINRVATAPSTKTAGLLSVYVADQTGTASAGTITTLQAYIDKRTVDIERAVVTAATGYEIDATGTVQVRRGQVDTVKNAASAAWSAYLASVPIGGDRPGGLVRISKLWQCLMDSGAFDASIMLNGGTVDVVLSAGQVPTSGGLLKDTLTWLEVS